MSKIVNIRCETDQTIHKNVDAQPEKDHSMMETRIIIRCGREEEQVPVDRNVSHAPSNQSKNRSSGRSEVQIYCL